MVKRTPEDGLHHARSLRRLATQRLVSGISVVGSELAMVSMAGNLQLREISWMFLVGGGVALVNYLRLMRLVDASLEDFKNHEMYYWGEVNGKTLPRPPRHRLRS